MPAASEIAYCGGGLEAGQSLFIAVRMESMPTNPNPPSVVRPSSDPQKDLLRQVTASLKDGSLELPSLPDVALEVRSVAAERDLGISDLVTVIQQDPGLSTYLIKVSNSVYYRRAKPALTLAQAISRLGVSSTRDLSSSYAIRTLFFMRNKEIKDYLRDIWQRSVYTGSLAHVMAERCSIAPDRALLAGLIQDIGALPLLMHLEKYPALLADRDKVTALINQYSGKISALILNAWHFDDELVNVGLERENWLRDKRPQADLADLILVARYHTFIGETAVRGLPPLFQIPAFRKLPLGELDPEEGLAFIKTAKAEVEAMRQALV